MTRIYKQQKRRNISPRKSKIFAPKTGPRKENLVKGYKEHQNAVAKEQSDAMFIPKIT